MVYYYARKIKDKEFMRWKKIPDANSLDEAKAFIITKYNVTNAKRRYSYKSEEEFSDYITKHKPAEEALLKKRRQALELDPPAVMIYERALEKDYEKLLKTKSSEIDSVMYELKIYGLQTNTHKPYYIYNYWYNGDNGSFGDLEDVEKAYRERLDSSEFVDFDVKIFESATGKRLYPKFDVKVSF